VNAYPTVRLFPAKRQGQEGQGNNKNESQYIQVGYGRLKPFDILLKLGVQASSGGEITSNTTPLVPPPAIARLAVVEKDEMTNAMEMANAMELAEASSSFASWKAAFDRQMVKKKDVYADMYRSLHFSLKYEVYASNEPLSPDSRDALMQWLRLLQTTMPPLWSQIHNLLNALFNDFDAIVSGEEQLAKVLDRFPPPDGGAMKWSDDCSHGEKGMGFTCGLWKLFHLMTVGVVVQQWNNNNAVALVNGKPNDDDSKIQIVPADAATILRNYIQHFFRCEVCRSEFVQTFDACKQSHCHALFGTSSTSSSGATTTLLGMAEWIQLPIWLFETHNAVTRRLLHEKAENDEDRKQPIAISRQDELDHEWPSRADCPKCWRPSPAAVTKSETTMSLFDQDHIYKFLRLEYWPEDDVASVYRSQLTTGVKSSSQGLRKNNDAARFPLWLPVGLSILLAVAWYSKMTVSRKKVKH
jgi:Erv1 / Alr family